MTSEERLRPLDLVPLDGITPSRLYKDAGSDGQPLYSSVKGPRWLQLIIGAGGEGCDARSAIGVASLPGNMTVEIEMIVRVKR